MTYLLYLSSSELLNYSQRRSLSAVTVPSSEMQSFIWWSGGVQVALTSSECCKCGRVHTWLNFLISVSFRCLSLFSPQDQMAVLLRAKPRGVRRAGMCGWSQSSPTVHSMTVVQVSSRIDETLIKSVNDLGKIYFYLIHGPRSKL